MAAVDRRMGMVRRGMTPTAPKPINLPSQKLENQGLIPDVEIVPRGTFCWGSTGRSSAANSKNMEGTDSTSLPLESTGAGDNGTNLQNALVSTDKLQGLAESSSPPLSVESSASPTSSTVCITSGETTVASAISGACISDAKTDSRSPAANDAKTDIRSPAASDAKPHSRCAGATDAGSLPDSVARSFPSKSGTSPSATPVTFEKSRVSGTKVEEQKKFSGFPAVGSEESDNIPNLQPKQGAYDSSESLPGSQDFGYFEGFYSNHHSFSRPGMAYSNGPGMAYSNGPGMAFGPGLNPDPSQHDAFYSFLGVPYYDSTKDKEIVVITMVGNPGFHGSYLPHSGFTDQYGRSGVYGNFPLQFGHFENFVAPGHGIPDGMPPLSAEMNPMCSGEQGEFVCYDQEHYKDGWFNESSVGEMQRGNGAYLPTSFSTFKSNPNLQGYNMPKRPGREKFSYRSKKAASKGSSAAVFAPERRVTLLTKVSQHEVVISSLPRKSKHVGNGQAVGLSGSPLFAQNSMEVPSCDPQCKSAIAPLKTFNAVRIHEVVDIEKSRAPDSLESPSASEMILYQATCTGSNNEGSILLSSCNKGFLGNNFEISASGSSSTSASTSTLTSQTHGRMTVRHQDTLAACCPVSVCQVPDAPSSNISSVNGNKARPKHEVRHVTFNAHDHIMNAAELPQDASLHVSTDSTPPTEQVNGENPSSTATAASLLHEHNQGSMPVLPNPKGDRKWRCKGFVADAKLGQERFNPRFQEAVMDKKALCPPSICEKARDILSSAGADSSPTSTMGGNPVSQCSVPVSSCAATSKEMLQGDCTEPDSLPAVKKSKKVHKAVTRNSALDSVAEFSSVQVLERFKKTTMKTIPLDSKNASYGFGKVWRLKPATKVLRKRASKAITTSKISGLQVTESCLINNRTDSKHMLEAFCEDNSEDKFKQQWSCGNHSLEDMQNESGDRIPLFVDKHTSKSLSATGIDTNNLTNREEKMEGHISGETLPPLSNSRVEERGHTWRLVRKQKRQQQVSLASKLDETKHNGGGDMPIIVDCCFKPYARCSNSSDAISEVDHKISKATKSRKFSFTSQVAQVKEKSKENEDASHVSQPMFATQFGKYKDLISEVSQSSKAPSGLRKQSSLRNCQEQRHLPVKKLQRHTGPAHFMEKDQPAGSPSRPMLINFRTNCMEQGHFVASSGENYARERGSSLDFPKFQKINQNSHYLQEGYSGNAHSHLGKFQKAWNYKGQSMHRWEQQRKWDGKDMHLQEQQPATTCRSVSNPCEGSRTFSDGKSCAENKQYVNLLQGASGVAWKPKRSSVVQIKDESLERGKDNTSTVASQKKKTPEECPVLESPSSASMSPPCGNDQQVRKQAFRKPACHEKEVSEVCPIVMSSSSALSYASCGTGEQGSVKPASQAKQAFDEGPAVASPSCALSSAAGRDGQHVSDMVKKASLMPASQMKMGPEDCPIVTSFSSAPLSSPCGNGQQVGNTEKQSYKAALERQHPAVARKGTSSGEQVVIGAISQPVSSAAIPLKSGDTPTKTVKPCSHHTSWRPKTVSGSILAKAAFSKERKENDPSASTHVEGAPKKHTHPLPSGKSAALHDLHVWKNNERHPVRASYGLPYWHKEYPQQQKSGDHQAKPHAGAASSLEHLKRSNEKFLDREFPSACFTKEVKHASPQKQAKTSPCRDHPGSCLKFSQHHAYVVKQAQSTCNQHSPVGNRRPFSMKSNFSHDDNKKVVHYQQPLSRTCTPMEQGNCRPFSTKSNFSYDDNKKVVHHQQSLSRISVYMEQGKVRENVCIRAIGHVEGICPSRGDNKPVRCGRFHNGWKAADFDRKGWVVKTAARC